MEPIQRYQLTIGVIGRSPRIIMEQAFKLIKEMENEELVVKSSLYSGELYYSDSSRYRMLHDQNKFAGSRLDQIIICDDKRWNVYDEKQELIECAKYILSKYSCVPEEFQIINLELP